MMCTMGMAPSSLVVLPINRVMTDEVPDANIMDHVPLVNIMPFGMCMSPANPMVAAATAAAMGVLAAYAAGLTMLLREALRAALTVERGAVKGIEHEVADVEHELAGAKR